MEKSLIIVKPDLGDNVSARNRLDKYIAENNLEIYNRCRVRFSEQMIHNMWPQFKDDVISNRILINYLTERDSEVLYVKGEEAIIKCLRIKKKIREKYSKSPFQSCIHSPASIDEYIHNYNLLTKGDNQPYDQIKSTPPFSHLKDFGYTEQYLNGVADSLWEILSKDRLVLFNVYNNLMEKESGSYSLILKDSNHPVFNISIEYVVCSILSIIPSLAIFDIYIYVMVAIMKGEATICFSDNNIYTQKIHKQLTKIS